MQLSLFDFIRRTFGGADPGEATALVLPRADVPPSSNPPSSTPGAPVAPAASLHELWCELRRQWFNARTDLDDYQVIWSTRAQKRTLASCNIVAKRVLVARELNYPQHRRWLIPLLYHEMCHAVIGENARREGQRANWHGREFKLLERRHPEIPALNRWIEQGGWLSAVRSDRSKRAHSRRRSSAAPVHAGGGARRSVKGA